MTTTGPNIEPPELPENLDDLGALDVWYTAWNEWISTEATKRNWPWLTPMTPATLHEIVESEKRKRAGEAEHQRELSEARAALTALGNRLAEQDPAYEKKCAILVPILKPILRDYPPAKWVQVFENAYGNLILPRAGSESPGAETPLPEVSAPSTAESEPQFGSDEAARLYWLTETPGRAFSNLREISEKIGSLFDKAELAAQRDSLLNLFFVTMGFVDGMLRKGDPGYLDEFRNANRQMLKNFWIRESLIGKNVDGKTLVAVSRREIARHRMASDCTPTTPGAEPVPPISERELGALNAEVDRQRRDAAAGVRQQGTQTVLLYRVPAFPESVGVSKVDAPVDGGAFFLDFSRPIHVTKRFLGKRNSRLGTAIELRAPVLHQEQSASDTNRFSIIVHSRDPRFAQVRALWNERYPSAARPTDTVVPGLKLLIDFHTQFPDGC
jgi:hypothetical protein